MRPGGSAGNGNTYPWLQLPVCPSLSNHSSGIKIHNCFQFFGCQDGLKSLIRFFQQDSIGKQYMIFYLRERAFLLSFPSFPANNENTKMHHDRSARVLCSRPAYWYCWKSGQHSSERQSSHTIAEASSSSTGVTSGSKLMAPER